MALLAIGPTSPEVLTTLRRFFALYRSDAESADMELAVISVAKILMDKGSPEDKAAVAVARTDSLTAASLRDKLPTMPK